MLVSLSDFVLESFPPGHMEAMGLGYDSLKEINPGIIMTSITPFGQKGPRSNYKDGDLIALASGGQLFFTGDPKRPPVRVGIDISYIEAGLHGAMGGLTALWYRQKTGEGQYVDVSIQECIACTVYSAPYAWEVSKMIESRMGSSAWYGAVYQREVWRCKDGYIVRLPFGGAWGAKDWYGLVKLMDLHVQ